MYSKKALAIVAILAFSVLAFAPVTDLVAEDEPELAPQMSLEDFNGGAIYNSGSDNAKTSNNFFYDCLLVLIIALIAAGGLHVKAHKK